MTLPQDEPDTHALLDRARRGERDAFAALVEPLRSRLLERIQERMGTRLRAQTDAEDVLHETLLRALRSIGRFRWQGPESFRLWLEAIAGHFLLHAGRSAARRQTLEIPRDSYAPGVSPSRAARREERLERLRRSIERLRPDYREVVRLARIEGLRVREIAERTGRTPSAVKNILFKAMRQLRESFGDTESLGLPERLLDEGTSRGASSGEDGQDGPDGQDRNRHGH